MVSFGQAKPAGLGHTYNAESDLMHHQFRLSILQLESRPGAYGTHSDQSRRLRTVFQIQTSRHLAIRFCGHSGRRNRRIVSALGFSSYRSDHMSAVWIHMAATSSTMQTWRMDPETPMLTSPFSSTSAPPTCWAPTALRAVNKLNKDGLNVKPPDLSDGRDDVDERGVVYP